MTPAEMTRILHPALHAQGVVPVLVLKDLDAALPLARALVDGGLPIMEVTLRTPCALDAIRAMATVPGAAVGAGSLRGPADVQAVIAAGARFGVAPGHTRALLDAAESEGLPLLPGAVTASEVLALLERGYEAMKFFPAEPMGGMATIKALGGPLAEAQFVPTGGIDLHKARAYLGLPNVLAVGGSWIAPEKLVDQGKWDAIRGLAAEASRLRG